MKKTAFLGFAFGTLMVASLAQASTFGFARRALPEALGKLGDLTATEISIAGSLERAGSRLKPFSGNSVREIETVLVQTAQGDLLVALRVQVSGAGQSQSVLSSLVEYIDRGLRSLGDSRRVIVRSRETPALQQGDLSMTAQQEAQQTHYLWTAQRGGNEQAPRPIADSNLALESRVSFQDFGSRTYASVNLTGLSEPQVTYVYRVISEALDVLIHEGERALLR